MIERPLMTSDELKSMEKGNFIVMKTGTHPFISKLKLFFKWGIEFDKEPYTVADKGAMEVKYTSREIIEEAIDESFAKKDDTTEDKEEKPTNSSFKEQEEKLSASENLVVPKEVAERETKRITNKEILRKVRARSVKNQKQST